MSRLFAFNKPFGVLSQFTADNDKQRTLAEFINVPKIYCAGRLDQDSEGLLLLTDDGGLQHRLSHPRHAHSKYYLAQVDGDIEMANLQKLTKGVILKDGSARALSANRIGEPALWPRTPPVRFRKHIPTSWIQLELDEGRNRQVRRMTAAINHPTLRLIRIRIANIELGQLQPGELLEIDPTGL